MIIRKSPFNATIIDNRNTRKAIINVYASCIVVCRDFSRLIDYLNTRP